MIARPSWGGVVDRARPRIGYAAFCQVVPDCGWSAVARNLREGLRKVADVVDIWDSPGYSGSACDAVLAVDCARPISEPYFIYLCAENGNTAPADPATYKRAAGLFAENGRRAQCLAEVTGVPQEKIHVVPPAVAGQYSRSIPAPCMRQAPRRKLLYISDCPRHHADSALVPLIDALEILRREHDAEIGLTISGSENWPFPGAPPAGVTFGTARPAGEMIALVDSHDLLAVPPGLGSAGLPEALSRGVPCVATRESEMSEAITPGVTGILIDDWDASEVAAATASILGDDELYRTCYERAPAMAAYFSWERVARQVAYVISREVGLIALLSLVELMSDDPRAARRHNLGVRVADFDEKVGHEYQRAGRTLLRRSGPGQVYVVGTPLTRSSWRYQIAYERAPLIKALAIRRTRFSGCAAHVQARRQCPRRPLQLTGECV